MKIVYKGDVKTVIKGVNKQIVEIKCTNNEYFDRALLFVNSRCNMFAKELSEEMAGDYIAQLISELPEEKKPDAFGCGKGVRVLLAVLICLLAATSLLAGLLLAV